MIYTESDATCAAALDTPSATLVAGIGTGADESQLDASGTALQIGHSRARRLAGFAFFAVDEELCASILPRLFPPPVP